jgi:hypothetical protein
MISTSPRTQPQSAPVFNLPTLAPRTSGLSLNIGPAILGATKFAGEIMIVTTIEAMK